MATMTIEIPDGMTAQILVGTPEGLFRREPLQITDQRPVRDAPEKRRRQPFLMATVGFAILAIGFTAGTHTRTSHWTAQAETASLPSVASATADPPPATVAFPAPAPATAPPAPSTPLPDAAANAGPQPGASGQVPPDLAAVLKAPPQVTPAPGQPSNQPSGQAGSSAPSQANPFGLGS
jgi:hypothetical protein